MTNELKNLLLDELIDDLDVNYRNDNNVLETLLIDVVNDALFMSNRRLRPIIDDEVLILKSNIKKAVKSIYLQRGTEDVSSSSKSGESDTYQQVMEIMEKDIIRQNKRLLF